MPTRRISEFAELSQFEIDPRSVRMLPRAFCERNHAVVLGRVDPKSREPITVGLLHPETGLARQLAARWGRPVQGVALNLYEIQQAIDQGFAGRSERGEDLPRLQLAARPAGPQADAVALADDAIRQALRLGATDIHLEVYRGDVDVRLRIDGVLHQLQTHIHPNNVQGVINRIKILAELDIAERRFPQDGRIRLEIIDPLDDGRPDRWPCDLRISVVPGPAGEDVVIRVLGGRLGVLPVADLGMPEPLQRKLLGLLANPEGLILVTGPTGSGKTTTLYSALSHLNDGARKILTAEDPVEYDLPKINQKQVGPNLKMVDLARAFLRQDPDVILVGEIRDDETADVAVRAAATGHVVLSTLHTSDALGAINRLRGLGLERDRVAEALLGVVAQRLIRRICARCSQPAEPTDEQRARLGPLLADISPRAGVGCRECNNTGYKGRIGIFELLVVDNDLQDEIAEGTHIHDLRERTQAGDFWSLVDDALDKARAGVTSLDEVLRVLPYRYLKSAVERASGG